MRQKRFTPRYFLNLIWTALLALILAAVFGTLTFTSRWTKSILYPSRTFSTGDYLLANQIPFGNVAFTTKDGLNLSAWYTKPENNAIILLAHGYRDIRHEDVYAMLVRHGYGVIAFDFRAHGGSEGEISTFGYYERMDVEAALDFALTQEGVDHVGAWGASMGAATLILSAAELPDIEAVIADSAYPSLEDVLRLNMPVRPFQPFVMVWSEYYTGADIDEVRPVDVIGRISPRPVFVIDGWEGAAEWMNSPYRLYEAAHEPKELWVEDGVPHLGMYANNPAEYEKRVIQFFDKWLLETIR